MYFVTHHEQMTNLGVRLFTFLVVLLLSQRVNMIVSNDCFCCVGKKLIFFVVVVIKKMNVFNPSCKQHTIPCMGLLENKWIDVWNKMKQSHTCLKFGKLLELN